MIVYEVNLNVDQDIAADYLLWLKHHMQEMLQHQGFVSAELYEVMDENPDQQKWCCHYLLKDQQSLDDYLQNHAASMRNDGIQRFGDRFSASRRIMQTEV